MTSDKQGAAQTAYQVLVAFVSRTAPKRTTVFDSGKISSSESVGSRTTDRCWNLPRVITGPSKCGMKADHWPKLPKLGFETGLTDGNWSNAKWIGSSLAQLSKYRSLFVIDYDVAVANGSQNAVFVFGARDAKNFVSVDLNVKEATFTIRHTKEGKESLDTTVRIPNLNGFRQASWRPTSSSKYAVLFHQSYDRRQTIWHRRNLRSGPYSDTELVHLCRPYAIGSNQPKGECPVLQHPHSEKSWNTTLYTMNENYQAGRFEDLVPNDGNPLLCCARPSPSTSPFRAHGFTLRPAASTNSTSTVKRVGEDFFNPGWTDYRFRFMYNTYDITSPLQRGRTASGVQLGTGLVERSHGLHVFLAGSIRHPSIRHGENRRYLHRRHETDIHYQRQLEMLDNGPITLTASWTAKTTMLQRDHRLSTGNFLTTPPGKKPPSMKLRLSTRTFRPISVLRSAITSRWQRRAWLNRNLKSMCMTWDRTWWAFLRSNWKAKPDREITIRYGEMNYPTQIPTKPVRCTYTIDIYKQRKGQVYTDNYRSALSTDHFILKGDADGEPLRTAFHLLTVSAISRSSDWMHRLHWTKWKVWCLSRSANRPADTETSDKRIKPTVWEYRLGTARQLPQRADRLPANAMNVSAGLAMHSIQSHGDLQHERRSFLHTMAL